MRRLSTAWRKTASIGVFLAELCLKKVSNGLDGMSAKHSAGPRICHCSLLPGALGGRIAVVCAGLAGRARLSAAEGSAHFSVAQMRRALWAQAWNFANGIDSRFGCFAFEGLSVVFGVVVGAIDFGHACQRCHVAGNISVGQAFKQLRSASVPCLRGRFVCNGCGVGLVDFRHACGFVGLTCIGFGLCCGGIVNHAGWPFAASA